MGGQRVQQGGAVAEVAAQRRVLARHLGGDPVELDGQGVQLPVTLVQRPGGPGQVGGDLRQPLEDVVHVRPAVLERRAALPAQRLQLRPGARVEDVRDLVQRHRGGGVLERDAAAGRDGLAPGRRRQIHEHVAEQALRPQRDP